MQRPRKLSLVAAIALALGSGISAAEGSTPIQLPFVPVSELSKSNQADPVAVESTDEVVEPVPASNAAVDEIMPDASNSAAIDVPKVSPAVLTENVPSGKPLAVGENVRTVKSIEDKEAQPSLRTERKQIVVKPGANELVNVALGHPNRIVTPFASPKVLKLDELSVATVKQNVIYFATDQAVPVTLYIREEGSEQMAISLTLIPQKIPPREIYLEFPEDTYAVAGGFASEKAKQWERNQPYEKTLTDLLRGVALGEVPQGYAMRKISSKEAPPLCQQRGLSFDFSNAQVLDGHDFKAFVGIVSNVATQPVEFVESNCASRHVVAVSAWPNVYLEPGQKSEVYVVEKERRERTRGKPRPSLLGGAK